MEKTNKIAAGLIVISIGVLITLCEYRHALFITGLFIPFSGVRIKVETIEKHENEN